MPVSHAQARHHFGTDETSAYLATICFWCERAANMATKTNVRLYPKRGITLELKQPCIVFLCSSSRRGVGITKE